MRLAISLGRVLSFVSRWRPVRGLSFSIQHQLSRDPENRSRWLVGPRGGVTIGYLEPADKFCYRVVYRLTPSRHSRCIPLGLVIRRGEGVALLTHYNRARIFIGWVDAHGKEDLLHHELEALTGGW